MRERSIDITGCERDACRHELARAVTLAELLSGDGPYPTLRFLRAADPQVAEPVTETAAA